VWTVNEEDDMRRLLEYGVSGIFTDFPQRLHKILKELK
jgi:glycerophosphoryl diester phosphodiesterase